MEQDSQKTKQIIRELELPYRPDILVKNIETLIETLNEVTKYLGEKPDEKIVPLKIDQGTNLSNLEPQIAKQLGIEEADPLDLSDKINEYLEKPTKPTTLVITLEEANIFQPEVESILSNLRSVSNASGVRNIIFTNKEVHPKYTPYFNHMHYIQ